MPRAGAGGIVRLLRRDNNNSSNGFYNKLFYILIAVLGAFALVSLLNYVRTRRRRLIVLAEAERLGLMVPGMEGYVPMRERPALRKLDGWRTPDWWEVLEKEDKRNINNNDNNLGAGKGKWTVEAEREASAIREHAQDASVPGGGAGGAVVDRGNDGDITTNPYTTPASAPNPNITVTPSDADYGARGALELGSLEELRPLALIPVPQLVSEPAKPISRIPYFPNYVSYLKTAHDPKPPRFAPDDPDAFDCIIGEPLDVVVAVRMPRPPVVRDTPLNPDDDDAVMDEWGGLELGVASWQVVNR